MIDLEPLLLQIPLSEPVRLRVSEPPVTTLSVALVRVISGDLTAYGEAALADPAVFVDAVDFFADTLANGKPRDYGLLYQRMIGLAREYQPDPAHDHAAVLSAIDMALWDLAGRELGCPISQLLGGSQTRQVDCYAGGLFADDPALADKAKLLRKRFAALQITLTGDLARDIRAVKVVRLAAGDEAPLLVDAGGLYDDFDQATALGQALERAEVFWLGEPLPAGRWAEYRTLRESVAPALAADKHLLSLRDFEAALQAEALDVAIADPRLCGGFSGARRLADLAWSHGARVTFHCGLSPLAQLAAAHLVTAYTHAGPIQVQPALAPLGELVEPPPIFANGFLRVPDAPGLGSCVSEDFVNKYRVELPADE